MASKSLFQHVVLTLAVAALGLVGCGDKDQKNGGSGSIGADTSAEIFVTPSTINFSKINIGDSTQQAIEIRSVGSEALKIESLELQEAGDNSELQRGDDWFESGKVPTGESKTVKVKYTPKTRTPTNGKIVIKSNNGESSTTEIPIQTPELEALITSRPQVVFTDAAPGQSQSKDLEVTNAGQAPLNLNDIYLKTADTPFSLGRDGSEPEAIGSTLQPSNSTKVNINYAPSSPQKNTNTIVFESNAANAAKYNVELVGRQEEPCLQLSLSSPVTYGEVDVGATKDKVLVMTNCGTKKKLKVKDIAISEGSDAFKVVEDTLPGSLPDNPVEIAPNGRESVKIQFQPTEEDTSKGKLKVSSNDPVNPEETLQLKGKGIQKCIPEENKPVISLNTGYNQQNDEKLPYTTEDEKKFDDDWKMVVPPGKSVNYEEGSAKVMKDEILWDCENNQRKAVHWGRRRDPINNTRFITFRDGAITTRDCDRADDGWGNSSDKYTYQYSFELPDAPGSGQLDINFVADDDVVEVKLNDQVLKSTSGQHIDAVVQSIPESTLKFGGENTFTMTVKDSKGDWTLVSAGGTLSVDSTTCPQ